MIPVLGGDAVMSAYFGHAKHYTFAWRPDRRLWASEMRRVSRALCWLDDDGPQAHHLHPDGCLPRLWRHPICTRAALERALSSAGVPYRYLMVPEGRDHELVEGWCRICSKDRALRWGEYCDPILVDSDWIVVDPLAVSMEVR